MDAALRLAVELPPLPAGERTDPVSLEPWWQIALAAQGAGAGAVWFTSGLVAGDFAGDSEGHGPACEACTIAAAAVTHLDTSLLGVVSALPADRHPAVLARDVTTLDVVSGGRAAVLLRWEGARPLAGTHEGVRGGFSDGHFDPCVYLGEAVAVCRSVFQDDDPVFEGRYLHVAGALNRPPPRRPGGPPLLVEAPAGVAVLVRREAGPAFLLRQVVSSAAAIVCPDDPGEIASWRALVEDAAAALWTGIDPDLVPAVVCRTTLRSGSADPTASRRSSSAFRTRLDAARAAGAGGVIVRMPSTRRGDTALHLEAGDSERISAEIAECFEPWRR